LTLKSSAKHYLQDKKQATQLKITALTLAVIHICSLSIWC